MNHPSPQEWAPYVFGETSSESKKRLAAHLKECGQCREELRAWERSLNRLDAWKLKPAAKALPALSGFFRWAAAGAALAIVAFGAGRVTAQRADAARVQAAILPSIREQVRLEMTRIARDEAARVADATFAVSLKKAEQAMQQAHQDEYQAILAQLGTIESQREADFYLLKRDVDTVALNADAGLRRTRQQLVRLADYAIPAEDSPLPQR